jgi:hypothetical protein
MATKKSKAKKQSVLAHSVSIRTWQVIVFVLAFACLGTYTVLSTSAAPRSGGKTSGTGSLALAMVSDVNSNGLPNWGDSVTFSVTDPATTEPHVEVTCSQNGTVVYSATTGYYASYPWPWTQTMELKSNSWTAGSADCTARLYHFDGRKAPTDATLIFQANA